MDDKDKFTEQELPRGAVLLMGRALDGRELACLVKLEHDPIVGNILRDFRSCLEFNKPEKIYTARQYGEASWPKDQWPEFEWDTDLLLPKAHERASKSPDADALSPPDGTTFFEKE